MSRRVVALVLTVLAGLGGALAWADRTSAAPEPSRQLTFRDRDGSNALALEGDPGSTRAGEFAFGVADGAYVGVERAAVELKDGHQLKVRYEGPADFVTSAGVSRVTVRLQGELDLRRHSGEAKLWVGPDPAAPPLRIKTPEATSAEAKRVLTSFEQALLGSDWPGLYAILSREITGSIAAADFAASAETQTRALGQVVEARRTALSDATTNPAGITYAMATYSVVRIQADGTLTRATYDIYLVLDPDTWRVWFSAPH